MRAILASALLLAATALLLTGTSAGEPGKKTEGKKGGEVTLKGNITCAKCELGLEKGCMTVIVAKTPGEKEDVVYYFDQASHKKYHGKVCASGMPGTVVGTISTTGEKKLVKVQSATFE